MVRTTLYKRFDKNSTIATERGKYFAHTTTQITFDYPRHIEIFTRYIKMYARNGNYLLDWNPAQKPSFGIWLDIVHGTENAVALTAHNTAGCRGTLKATYTWTDRQTMLIALRGIVGLLDSNNFNNQKPGKQ